MNIICIYYIVMFIIVCNKYFLINRNIIEGYKINLNNKYENFYHQMK